MSLVFLLTLVPLAAAYQYDYYHNPTGQLSAHYDDYQDYGFYAYNHAPAGVTPRPPMQIKYAAKSFAQVRRQPHRSSPMIVKTVKKTKKKRKTLSVQKGFFVAGGTQMFGKFSDLHSCIKACEITATCFAGDFNPWLGKCFFHGNVTGCGTLRSHQAIVHFKKVPCDVISSARGIVVLGISVVGGLEIKKVNTLAECIKRCSVAGGGVASLDTQFQPQNQVCCGVNYDFASHKCYFLVCPDNFALLDLLFCNDGDVGTPLNSLRAPTVVSITICPMTT